MASSTSLRHCAGNAPQCAETHRRKGDAHGRSHCAIAPLPYRAAQLKTASERHSCPAQLAQWAEVLILTCRGPDRSFDRSGYEGRIS
jgi:hypothetical protein